jgi:hypothetical protein
MSDDDSKPILTPQILEPEKYFAMLQPLDDDEAEEPYDDESRASWLSDDEDESDMPNWLSAESAEKLLTRAREEISKVKTADIVEADARYTHVSLLRIADIAISDVIRMLRALPLDSKVF